MELIFREATGADAAEMIRYTKTVGKETDYLSYGENTFNISEEKEARFLERFKNSKKSTMLVATLGDKIVGSASIEANRVERYSHRAELSITVLRDYWGRGIGREFMRRLIEFSKASGFESVYLDVRSDNLRAISLYSAYGFRKIGTYEGYFKINGKNYDADLMVLKL